ncbi:hypothetical protein [Devosia geojensis]|uniref:hypothetical protein n=1 Tax=Devosia geojensis TaxID=443610 RepID=UPI00128B81DB|nr:hypothetical protein [Devosia geojensis]
MFSRSRLFNRRGLLGCGRLDDLGLRRGLGRLFRRRGGLFDRCGLFGGSRFRGGLGRSLGLRLGFGRRLFDGRGFRSRGGFLHGSGSRLLDDFRSRFGSRFGSRRGLLDWSRLWLWRRLLDGGGLFDGRRFRSGFGRRLGLRFRLGLWLGLGGRGSRLTGARGGAHARIDARVSRTDTGLRKCITRSLGGGGIAGSFGLLEGLIGGSQARILGLDAEGREGENAETRPGQ